MAGTVRRCVICGRSEPKAGLLRFIETDRGIEWDREHRLPGRGAYVHPAVPCWSRMGEVGRWRHSFRGGEGITREGLAAVMDEVRSTIVGLGVVGGPAPGVGRGKVTL